MASSKTVVEELRKRVKAESVATVADTFNVTPQYIYMILNGNKAMTDEIALWLGYQPVEKRWARIKKEGE